MFCPGLLDVGFCTLYDDALFYDYVGGPGFLPSPDRESSDAGARGRSKAGVAGLLWGLAIATKLTCLLLAPALACCYSLTLARVQFDYKTLKARLSFLSVFLVAVVTVVLFMSLVFRNSDFASLWRSHSVASNGSEARLHVFDPVKYLSSTIGLALLVLFLAGVKSFL